MNVPSHGCEREGSVGLRNLDAVDAARGPIVPARDPLIETTVPERTSPQEPLEIVTASADYG